MIILPCSAAHLASRLERKIEVGDCSIELTHLTLKKAALPDQRRIVRAACDQLFKFAQSFALFAAARERALPLRPQAANRFDVASLLQVGNEGER